MSTLSKPFRGPPLLLRNALLLHPALVRAGLIVHLTCRGALGSQQGPQRPRLEGIWPSNRALRYDIIYTIFGESCLSIYCTICHVHKGPFGEHLVLVHDHIPKTWRASSGGAGCGSRAPTPCSDSVCRCGRWSVVASPPRRAYSLEASEDYNKLKFQILYMFLQVLSFTYDVYVYIIMHIDICIYIF